jgi:hypothetical protein
MAQLIREQRRVAESVFRSEPKQSRFDNVTENKRFRETWPCSKALDFFGGGMDGGVKCSSLITSALVNAIASFSRIEIRCGHFHPEYRNCRNPQR